MGEDNSVSGGTLLGLLCESPSQLEEIGGKGLLAGDSEGWDLRPQWGQLS